MHTGQHHDDELSAVFFAELDVPAPDRELGIAGGSNASQTARMLGALEPVLTGVAPEVVLVYGDTNSTLAGALAGAQGGVPVAHVEAGMRSFDRAMPEELNRVLVDHASTLLLSSTPVAVDNLAREAVSGEVALVGDVMIDIAKQWQPRARSRLDFVRARGVAPGRYVLATAHRAGTVDSPHRLRALVDVLEAVPERVVFSVHPRTADRLRRTGLLGRLTASRVVVTPPLSYLELTTLLCHARAVLTDSGGLQKEAYVAGVPCVTLRASTEWIETVQHGWNVLVDLDPSAAVDALTRSPPGERPEIYGDGHAGARVVAALERWSGQAAASSRRIHSRPT